MLDKPGFVAAVALNPISSTTSPVTPVTVNAGDAEAADIVLGSPFCIVPSYFQAPASSPGHVKPPKMPRPLSFDVSASCSWKRVAKSEQTMIFFRCDVRASATASAIEPSGLSSVPVPVPPDATKIE
jgi:hypothetical protein